MDWHTRYVQQAQWTAALRSYWLQQAGVSAASRVLEVGCGTGAVLAGLPGQPVGVDIDPAALAQAARNAPQARLARGNALRLPFPDGAFDVALAHFLLLWVKHPLQALAEMRRVVRPGGWVMALAEPDYGGRVDYPEAGAALGRLQTTALQAQGADPFIGRKLRALFVQAGLREVRGGVLGGEWGPTPDGAQTEEAVLRADLEHAAAPEALDAWLAQDQAAWQQGERTLFVPTFYALGLKLASES
jgi:SAM-dependent methyltransferase